MLLRNLRGDSMVCRPAHKPTPEPGRHHLGFGGWNVYQPEHVREPAPPPRPRRCAPPREQTGPGSSILARVRCLSHPSRGSAYQWSTRVPTAYLSLRPRTNWHHAGRPPGGQGAAGGLTRSLCAHHSEDRTAASAHTRDQSPGQVKTPRQGREPPLAPGDRPGTALGRAQPM